MAPLWGRPQVARRLAIILQRSGGIGRTSAGDSQLRRATVTDLKGSNDDSTAQADNHIRPRRIVRRRQIGRRRRRDASGMRMIDADDLERRRTGPQRAPHRDVLPRIEPVTRGARRRIAHRDRMADAAARADQQSATLTRTLSTRVSDERASHGGRQVQSGHDRSSARSRKCSSASGLASASRLTTARPCTMLRTASSTIFPLLVRGISATSTIRAGTWRGDA